jgi:hypothetical protein
MDPAIAAKLLAIIEEDREDFGALMVALYVQFLEPLPLPPSLDTVLKGIAGEAGGYGFDKVVAFLKEAAGIVGDDSVRAAAPLT